MTYATAMVALELGRSNEKLLAFAGDLAMRLGISLMGIAACQPMTMIYDQTMILGDYVQEDRDELDAEVKAAKVEFESSLADRGIALEWHSTVTIGSLCEYTVARARAADIILCATGGDETIESSTNSPSTMPSSRGRIHARPVALWPTRCRSSGSHARYHSSRSPAKQT